MKKISIGIIGAGVMGKALATNLLKKKITAPKQLLVCDKDNKKLSDLKKRLGIAACPDATATSARADYIVLAVKPQDFSALAATLAGQLKNGQIVISIMAGVPLARLSKELGTRRVIRAMPNLAAQIGQAMVVWKSGFNLSRQEKTKVTTILGSLGRTLPARREAEIDMATALSGSGPAYVYYFMEALGAAGRALGFSNETARKLVDQTAFGAINFYRQSREEAAILRAKVTSKGGTTAAALSVLEQKKFKETVVAAVKAAYQRAKELSR